MAYDTHWQRRERWKVIRVKDMGSTLIVGDFLRFEGDAGAGTGTLIKIDSAGGEATWGNACLYDSGLPETITVGNLALGIFLITRVPGVAKLPHPDTPARLVATQPGPTGAEWTAEEQLPPLP